MILESEEATAAERAAAQLRLDELEAGSRGQLYIRLDGKEPLLPPGVVTMEKTEVTNPPINIIDSSTRRALIAKIKRQQPDFEAGNKSDAYLEGYSQAMDPVGGSVAKSTVPYNPGPGGGKLDEDDVVRQLASRQVARIAAVTRWCTTPEQRNAAIARLDALDTEMELRAQERDARVASSQRLDSNSDDLSPVVKAQIAHIQRNARRARAPIGSNEGGGNDAA